MKKEHRIFIIDWLTRIYSSGFFSLQVSMFIACQFALESDFGCSKLATEHNNYCGMKIPHRRCFYGVRLDGCQFAHYASSNCCIHDYISWVMFNRPLTFNLHDVESFKLFLRDSGYCPEKDYISRITNIFNQFTNGQTK